MMFGAALLSARSGKTDPVDVGGNVKIPLLKSDDNNDCRSVSWSPELEHHTALLGIPVANASMGNTTFSLESSFIDLKSYNMIAKLEMHHIPQYRDFNWPESPPEHLGNGRTKDGDLRYCPAVTGRAKP